MYNQTPVHEIANLDLLKIIPRNVQYLLEVGCSSGALAREYKIINPNCHYKGMEIQDSYAELAKRYCDSIVVGDIECQDEFFWDANAKIQCWIFADVLEHLKNPWECLKKIYNVIPEDGSVIACIPNIQHWSVPVNISLGNFRYQDIGLMDKTHLRWFTRRTIIELFESSGFDVIELVPRIYDEPLREKFLSIIQTMATSAGGNASEATRDALPLQFLLRAIKKKR